MSDSLSERPEYKNSEPGKKIEFPEFNFPVEITSHALQLVKEEKIVLIGKNLYFGNDFMFFDDNTTKLDIYKKPGNNRILLVDCINKDRSVDKISIDFDKGIAQFGSATRTFEVRKQPLQEVYSEKLDEGSKIVADLLSKYQSQGWVSKQGAFADDEIAVSVAGVRGRDPIFKYVNGKFLSVDYEGSHKPMTPAEFENFIRTTKHRNDN